MAKLVSILMPTRGPVDGLLKALRSIKSTASDYSQVEVLLRMDSDDTARIGLWSNLKDLFDVRVIIGQRGRGYLDMGRFIDDLVAVADSQWCWLFDDDAWVEGNTWQEQIAATVCDPENGPALNSQFYKLGGSTYNNSKDGGPVGLIVPTAFAKGLEHRNPVDQQWLDVLLSKGWKINQLKGVIYQHEGRPR